MLAFKAWKLPGTFLMIETKFVMKLLAFHLLFPSSIVISVPLFPTLGQPLGLQGCFLIATDAVLLLSLLPLPFPLCIDDHRKARKDWEKL